VSKSLPIADIALRPRMGLGAKFLPVRDVLECVPSRAIEIAAENGIRIRVLEPGERYRDASSVLQRLSVDVEAWPVPPAGLFVVEERTLHLRSTSPMTVAHEFGHALDCALGGGVYRSGYDSDIRTAFRDALNFVTPYAAVSVDEYFAECFRSFIEVGDVDCPWPTVTRERLALFSPHMLTWFEREIGQVEVAVA
jgi:hypothetical protein